MSPRITVNLSASGELEVWVNEQGRDLLVRKLQALSEKSDHFHLGPPGFGEVEISPRAYRLDDKVIEYGKILFRRDEWDKEHFPHVLQQA